MNIISKKSTKLFYNKYLYKITFDLVLSNYFRTCNQRTDSLDYANNIIADCEKRLNSSKYTLVGYYRKRKVYRPDIEDAKIVRSSLLTLKDYMVRSERDYSISIYCNDKNSLLPLLSKLSTVSSIKVEEPDPSQIKQLTTEENILVSKFAKDYSHKVTINLYKLRPSNSELLKWIAANRNKIKITDYALNQATSYVSAYVRDEKVLLLLQMAGDQYIKSVEKLILPA